MGGVESVVREGVEGLVVVEITWVVGERVEVVGLEDVEEVEGLIEEGVVKIEVLGADEVVDGLREEAEVERWVIAEVETGV